MEQPSYVHVISFDIPVPVNYGGAIDVYHKLKAFQQAGVQVILHCFQYNRQPAPELDALCHKVYYYPRLISKSKLFLRQPYIVVTRTSDELLKNLLSDNHPILFEGLHTTHLLNHSQLSNRKKVVRTHNIEHDYYQGLANVEKNLFKRFYFLNESRKLERYEQTLAKAQALAAISKQDTQYLSSKFRNVHRISAFHPHQKVDILQGNGDYALYHGSLDVGENNQAAQWLINNIFSKSDIRLIIAGNKPSKELKELAANYANVEIKTGLDTDEIYQLIQQAHINILPTFQATGIKLKLLAALFTGRHCVVNTPMILNTGLKDCCEVYDEPEQMLQAVNAIMKKPFTNNHIQNRKSILQSGGFSNEENIQLLNKILFD